MERREWLFAAFIPLLTPEEVAQLPGIHVWSEDLAEPICCVCKLPRDVAEGSDCPGYSERGTICEP